VTRQVQGFCLACYWPKAANAGGLGAEPLRQAAVWRGRTAAGVGYGWRSRRSHSHDHRWGRLCYISSPGFLSP
jgi:hypothetical protein